MKALGAGLLVASLLLAGCTGKEDADADAPGNGSQGDAPGTAAGTYSVAGTVTDASISPLSGVRVTLLPRNDSQATDGSGEFSFADLAPGTYALRFSADRFLPAARAFEVVNASVRVDLALLDAPSRDPTVDDWNATGFVECAFGLAGHGLPGPGGEGVFSSCIAATPGFGGVGNPTNEKIRLPFTAGPNLTGMRLTLTWDPRVPGTAAALTMLLEQEGSGGASGYEYARAGGPSPVVLDLDATGVEAAMLASGAALQVRVFPGTSTEPAVALQQDFGVRFQLAYFGAPVG